jgi:hypothetical protein
MYIGNSVFGIKTEIYCVLRWKQRDGAYTRTVLKNTTSQHCHSWRNGVPTGELLSSLVYLLSKWHCQCVQLCVVYVGHALPCITAVFYYTYMH